MTEIPKNELVNYFGKEIIMQEGSVKKKVIFDRIKNGWIHGFCKSTFSFIEVLSNSKTSELSTKFFIE